MAGVLCKRRRLGGLFKLDLMDFLDRSGLVRDEAQKTMHKVLRSEKFYKGSNTHILRLTNCLNTFMKSWNL